MNEKTPARPKWRYRIFQFSIRTMFLVTAAVAIFCNWYFQPQRKDGSWREDCSSCGGR